MDVLWRRRIRLDLPFEPFVGEWVEYAVADVWDERRPKRWAWGTRVTGAEG